MTNYIANQNLTLKLEDNAFLAESTLLNLGQEKRFLTVDSLFLNVDHQLALPVNYCGYPSWVFSVYQGYL